MPCFKMKFFHFFSHSTPILGKGGSQPRPPTAASSATTIQVHQMARMVEGLLLQQPNRQRTAITSRSVIGISNAARSNEVSGNSFLAPNLRRMMFMNSPKDWFSFSWLKDSFFSPHSVMIRGGVSQYVRARTY